MNKEVNQIIEEILSLSNCKSEIDEKIIKAEIEKVFIIGEREGIKSLKIKDD